MSNYNVQTTNGNLAIGKAALTIAGAATSTTYNGQSQSNTFSTTGLFGNDSVTSVSGVATGKNAGTYADTLSEAGGTGLANYNISYTNGALNIGKAPLTDDVPLGTCQIPWPAVLKEAAKAGVKYYFIEDESPTPNENIPQSVAYIRSLGL